MSMHTVSSELERTLLFLLLLSWICTVFAASASSRPSPWFRRPTTSASAAGAASRPNLANQTPTTPAIALTLRSATYTHSLDWKRRLLSSRAAAGCCQWEKWRKLRARGAWSTWAMREPDGLVEAGAGVLFRRRAAGWRARSAATAHRLCPLRRRPMPCRVFLV
ncbi:hypothetical protein ZWY2020_017700 [Hordeum vulgare]|nr:hypothetical protein ZWY2020_017700 [Hordeum vulgare]